MPMDEVLSQFAHPFHNFHDAHVMEVRIGLCEEVMMTLRPLVWRGGNGHYEGLVTIHFEGVKRFSEVAEKLGAIMGLESEVGFLGRDETSLRWRGGVHKFRFESNRRDFEFSFCCGNVR